MRSDESRSRAVRIEDSVTQHAAVITETNSPVIAAAAEYDLLPSNFRTFTGLSGSVTTANREYCCSSGTDLGSYGTIQSFRSVNYRTGGSATIRISGRFETAAPLTWSGMGAITIGDEMSFGYNGTTFGVWHRYGGLAEVRTLTITTPASGSENATITINDTAYVVPLTAGTPAHNSWEISEWFDANVTEYKAEQNDGHVIISAQSDGAKHGTWSFSSSTAVASFAQDTAGVSKSFNHIPQENWNRDTMGLLDPSKGNDYEIRYSNAYGNIEFYVMDHIRDRYIKVHTIKWANKNTETNLGNPSMHIGGYATSIAPGGDAVNVYITSLAAYDTAQTNKIRNPRATSNTKSISTTETSIMQIRCNRTYNGYINQAEIEPVYITLANDGTKQAVFRLIGNPTLNGEYDFNDIGTDLISAKDTAATTYVSGGRFLAEFTVGRQSSLAIDLNQFNIRLPPTLRLCITGQMVSGSAADLTATLTWYEDVY